MRTVSMLATLAALLLVVSGCAHEHECGPSCCAHCCEYFQAPDREPEIGGMTAGQWAARAATAEHENRQEIAVNLARFGPSALCYAREFMASTDDTGARYLGCEVVRLIGPGGQDAIPDLARLCGDHEPSIRGAAARALGAQERHYAQAGVAALGPLIDDEVWSVRYHAAESLGAAGYEGHGWVGRLEHRSHHDSDIRVRRACANAVVSITTDWMVHRRLTHAGN
ncbi:MAG: hypothetical protein CMJ18_23030 [Phycisphaeraceae bacterium]|nr:hypothetical protein [Phycisphaeraceae bacterium]